MGVFPSGQWGQTVNLLLFSFGGSNPPAPTKNSSIRTGYWSFCFVITFPEARRVDSNSIDPPNSPAGKKAPVQQRRPLPAAESGRSCWGCGQQDARAAQGTMQPLGAATRAPFLRGSRNPPAPAKNSNIRTGYWSFCFICYAKGMQGEIRAISIYTLPHRYCICPRPVIPYK